MKTVAEKLSVAEKATREARIQRLDRCGKPTPANPAPRSRRLVPLASALAAQLRLGLESDDAAPDRRVLVDQQLDRYRIVLIRETRRASAEINLSPREQEIVRMVARGLPNKAIAAVLEISSWTVGTHLRRVFAKLGVTCRAAMVAKLMDLDRNRPFT